MQVQNEFTGWNDETVLYNQQELANAGNSVQRAKNCFAVIVTNTGDTPLRFNNRILYPGVPGTSNGDSVSMGDATGKLFKGQIRIVFQAPIGAAPQVEVCQLYYLTN